MAIDIRHLVKPQAVKTTKAGATPKIYHLFLKGSDTYVKGTLAEFQEAFAAVMKPASVQAKLYRRENGKYFDVLTNTEYQRIKRSTVFIKITDLN